MAKEYEVLQFKAGNFQDNFGNTWCDMALKGVSEPVRIVVKDPTTIKDGDTLYGEIKEQTSKAGKTYLRFHREKPEDQQSFTPRGGSHKPSYQPRDDAGIKAQFAIKAAIQYQPDGATLKDVEEAAIAFFKMVDRVKNSEAVTDSAQGQTNPGTTKEFSNMEDAEFQSLVGSNISKSLDEGTPINMDDIPF